MRVGSGQTYHSPEAHSCERAQVSGKQRYSRGFGSCNRAISRNSGQILPTINGLKSDRSSTARGGAIKGCGGGRHSLALAVASVIPLITPVMMLRLLLLAALLLVHGEVRAE